MQLADTTPLPADLAMIEAEVLPGRLAVLTAKATFRFDAGRATLCTQAPVPILRRDEVTELGTLPADVGLGMSRSFEVITLAVAHSPRARPVSAMRVGLRVGDARREIAVLGDRRWIGSGEGARPSAPVPFVRMPLTWSRAFGGRSVVEIDRGARLEVVDPWNPEGRGIDAMAAVGPLCSEIGVPAGYPIGPEERLLPNLEDPAQLVARWSDAPRPACWATVPDGSLLRSREPRRASRDAQRDPGSVSPILGRAHPDWAIGLPAASAEVTLEGLTLSCRASFPLPRLRVVADYAVGTRRGTVALWPRRMVLLPEQDLFTVVYRGTFEAPYAAGLRRAARLRLEEGWYPAEPRAPERAALRGLAEPGARS